MNTAGRLFVFLVFIFSLGFLALAIGVYANHLTFKSKSKEQPGIVDRTEQRIKDLAYARDRAKARYDAAYKELADVEDQRVQRRAFYAVKLEMLKSGKDDKGNVVANPVFELKQGKDGLVPLKMLGTPEDVIQVRGQPLQALTYYQQQLAARHADILAENKTAEDLQTQLAKLTDQMQGPTGLIAQKALQVEARVRAQNEQEFLKPALANRFSEAVILLKREKALREQLEKGR